MTNKLNDYIKDELSYTSSNETELAFNVFNETIWTVFTVQSNGKLVGFYDFNPNLIGKSDQALLVLSLNQLYINPELSSSI